MKRETLGKIYNGKWYGEPQIYDLFSVAEDIDNVCLNKIKNILGDNFRAKNPIDLASGSGRMIDYIRQEIPYSGIIYAIEAEKTMCDFLEEKYNSWEAVVIKSTIKRSQNHPILNCIKSNFIVSRFGFPSKIWDKTLAREELESVCSLLENNGWFITIGWKEDFNDELNQMWYKYVPDGIIANTFDKWRKERASVISSPRNTYLTLREKEAETELRFYNLQESAFVMGKLFGNKALKYVVNNNKISWKMKMSITADKKQDLIKTLKKYEKRA